MQMLSYVTPMVGTVATVDTTIPVLADKFVALLRYKLLGFFRQGGPKFTVSELNPPTGTGRGSRGTDAAVEAMQTMGLLRNEVQCPVPH